MKHFASIVITGTGYCLLAPLAILVWLIVSLSICGAELDRERHR